MILTSMLQARANRGYTWLRDYGPVHDLDVKRLHRSVDFFDVTSTVLCPLAIADTGAAPPSGNRYAAVLVRLKHSPGFRHMDMDRFLTDHGFDIWPRGNVVTRTVSVWIFNAGGMRDFRVLNKAWYNVIAANATSLDD